MFCPICSQQQISEQTRFCSRCGFLLTGVSQLIASGGVPSSALAPADPNLISPRKKGVKQGAALMLSGLFIVPILAIITAALDAEPVAVAITAIITFWGGLLRILYALIFESKTPTLSSKTILPDVVAKKVHGAGNATPVLPASAEIPANSYVPPTQGNWRETNDLAAPPSVTDETTKFLTKK